LLAPKRQVEPSLRFSLRNIDGFVSWLIHSDYFLLASWLLLLGVAFVGTFGNSPVRGDRPARREIPPVS